MLSNPRVIAIAAILCSSTYYIANTSAIVDTGASYYYFTATAPLIHIAPDAPSPIISTAMG